MPVNVQGTVIVQTDLMPGLVRRQADLKIQVEGFHYSFNNSRGYYAGDVYQDIPNDSVRYVSVVDGGTLSISDGWPSSLHIRLAKVVTSGGVIVDIEDHRILMGAGVFSDAVLWGTEYTYASEDAPSSTTSNTYIRKMRMTTGTLPAGGYHFQWYFSITASKANKKYAARVRQDDTTDISEMPSLTSDVDLGCNCQGGYKRITLEEGAHTFDIDFKRVDDNIEVSIGNARLVLWRIS